MVTTSAECASTRRACRAGTRRATRTATSTNAASAPPATTSGRRRNAPATIEQARATTAGPAYVEQDGALVEPVVANGGSRRQIDRSQKPRKQAKPVATGCHRLRATLHGKEGVDGSSPSEGSAKAALTGLSVCVQSARRAISPGMEPFMELSRRERARMERLLACANVQGVPPPRGSANVP